MGVCTTVYGYRVENTVRLTVYIYVLRGIPVPVLRIPSVHGNCKEYLGAYIETDREVPPSRVSLSHKSLFLPT